MTRKQKLLNISLYINAHITQVYVNFSRQINKYTKVPNSNPRKPHIYLEGGFKAKKNGWDINNTKIMKKPKFCKKSK